MNRKVAGLEKKSCFSDGHEACFTGHSIEANPKVNDCFSNREGYRIALQMVFMRGGGGGNVRWEGKTQMLALPATYFEKGPGQFS